MIAAINPETWQYVAPFFWFGVLMFGVATSWIASAARRGLEDARDAARDRHPSTWRGGDVDEKR